jgi:hypothetical protein
MTAASIGVYNSATLDMHNCIVAGSQGPAAVYCWEGGTATLGCNDYYENHEGFFGCSPGSTDIFADPMLCDPENENFYLDCQSPCADLWQCGRIGALGVGCGSTRTESVTWSKVKLRYH